jgi:hypothetical protein
MIIFFVFTKNLLTFVADYVVKIDILVMKLIGLAK